MTPLHVPELPLSPRQIAVALDGYEGFARDALIATLLLNLTDVPHRQRVVANVLLDHPHYLTARTYPQVAARLGVCLGTVHEQMRRLRVDHPGIYRHVRAVRLHVLGLRHSESLERTHQRRHEAKRRQRHHRYLAWKRGTAPAPWTRRTPSPHQKEIRP